MGYHVELINSDTLLKANHQEEIFRLWKELNSEKYNQLKTAGTWTGGKRVVYCYPSMDRDYDKTVTSVKDILKMLGFTYYTKKNKDIKIKSYNSKSGAELIFFTHISHLIDSGSTMLWEDENNRKYIWHFEDQKLTKIDYLSYKRTLLHKELSNNVISKINTSNKLKI